MLLFYFISCEHLEGTETHVILIYVRFIAVSPYFSMVQPHMLANHKPFNLDAGIVKWMLDI